MSYYFLSYSREDKAIANQLTDDLINIGQEVWLDTRDIELGVEWEKRIEDAVERCDGLLVLCSPHSAASKYVKAELEMALAQHKPVIPILLKGRFEDMPSDLDIKRFNGLDFSEGYPSGFATLTQSLFPNGVPVSLQEMLSQGHLTFAEAKTHWKQAISHSSGKNEIVQIPVARTEYCSAYLVGQGFSPLTYADQIQVALQFSGSNNEDFLNTVVDYLSALHQPLWCVLIQGPLNPTRTEYVLPDDKPEIWSDGVEITWAAIERVWRRPKPLHFFSRSPVPLAMGIGFRKHLMSSVYIHSFNRSAVDPDKLYSLVYTYHPR